MNRIILIFTFILHFVNSTKKSTSHINSEIIDLNFKNFGKFAQGLFRDSPKGKWSRHYRINSIGSANVAFIEKTSKRLETNLRKSENQQV